MKTNMNISKINTLLVNYTPETMSATKLGIQMANMQIIWNNYYRLRYMRRTRSNNWLKMHGYPMRRKSRRRL